MPNLMLTTACNLQCEYCFAMEMLAGDGNNQFMQLPLFRAIMDWVDRGGMPELTIQLMGGEPTLSPHFPAIVEELQRRGRKVIVFSNGTVPLADTIIKQTHSYGVEWVININQPELYPARLRDNLHNNLAALGHAASLNVNFFSVAHSYDFVFDFFDRFASKRLLKIGIAHPVATKKNTYIAPGQWSPLRAILDDFFAKAQAANIHLATECGVPACLFKELHSKYPGLLVQDEISHCGSRLDITPAGRLINCLPLSKIATVDYDAFADYQQASLWFHEFLMQYRALGWVDDCCDDCDDLQRGDCRVCLAQSIGEFSRIPIPPVPGKADDQSAA